MNYREQKEKMLLKYKYAIYALSIANEVDIDTAFEMLKANIMRGGLNDYVNVKDFKEDYNKLVDLATK